ncbi:uncharacterized protein LOC122036091 [Zingiber officinale]|uniref:DUF4408 domain-containing protein n=1 Tax=Zingiber officinale TaxID=94328 RepID=A0A8J5CQ03_ZINOF|nr:uncharacterized protein LOC122036091 [Zingiber officinale]XP_042451218.1 uncharacterized protein LOC122036091 [Zingiber officinale]KAG6466530.1 hypothetical protein ZIOFF_075618 [Zingiber officinale]
MHSRNRCGGGDSWASMGLRAALTSAGVVTVAVALRLAGLPILWFLAAEVPRVYDSALDWIRPPYLYLVINGIIISIAASSRFQKKTPSSDDPPQTQQLAAMDPADLVVQGTEYGTELADDAQTRESIYDKVKEEAKDEVIEEEEEEFVISRSNWSPKRRKALSEDVSREPPASSVEKPLVSTRFSHRKAAKPSPEGKALGVARKPRRNETLESTWRTITEGRAVPFARHLKKSDTWDTRGERQEAAAVMMRKSETFNERAAVASASPGSGGSSAGRLRREASLGHDELNRRVEAFIKKFNDEMRLQRQESLRHYREMVSRDSH